MSLRLPLIFAAALLAALGASAAEHRVRSSDDKLALVVSDYAGLRYRVELDGKPLLADSKLGLEFADGLVLGPAAKITDTEKSGPWSRPPATSEKRAPSRSASPRAAVTPPPCPASRPGRVDEFIRCSAPEKWARPRRTGRRWASGPCPPVQRRAGASPPASETTPAMGLNSTLLKWNPIHHCRR